MFNLIATLVVVASVSGVRHEPTRLATTSPQECVTNLFTIERFNSVNREHNTRTSFNAHCELRLVEAELAE